MRLCVGDSAFKKSYFEHTNDLENTCNQLSGSPSFFTEINTTLTELRNLKRNSKKNSEDYRAEIKKIHQRRIKGCFESVIVNLVVPKLKTLRQESERRDFIKCVFREIDDDLIALKTVRDLLIKTLSMSPEEVLRENDNIRKADEVQRRKIKVIAMIENKSTDYSNLQVDESDNVFAKLPDEGWIKIERDEELLNLVYNSMDFQLQDNMDDFFEGILNGENHIAFPQGMTLIKRKKFLATLKQIASKKGYRILNEYTEVTPKDKLRIDVIKAHPTFADLKLLVQKYDIRHTNPNDFGSALIIVNRKTNNVVEDVSLINSINMAYFWLGTYNHAYQGEKIRGLTDAFDEEIKDVYSELMRHIRKNIQTTGDMNLREVYTYASNYHNSRMIRVVRQLLEHPEYYDIVYKYVLDRIPDKVLQATKETTTILNVNKKQDDREMNDGLIEAAVDDVVGIRK